MKSSRKRLDWIDHLRAFAYLLVVVSHASYFQPFNKLANSFHMPLFFITSGLLINSEKIINEPILKQFLHKLKVFGVPYLWIQFSLLPVWYLNNRVLTTSSRPLGDIILGILVSQNRFYPAATNPTWFLGALLFATMYITIIFKIAKRREILRLILVIATVSLGFYYSKAILPYHMNTALIGAGFIYFGYLLREYILPLFDRTLANFRMLITGSALCIGMYVILGNSVVAMVYGSYGQIPLFLIGSSLTCFGIVLLFYNNLKDIVFVYLGQNTLYHLGLHMILIHTLRQLIPGIMYHETGSMIMGFVILFGLLPIIALINRFWPYMNGKTSYFTRTPGEWLTRYIAALWVWFIPCYSFFYETGFFLKMTVEMKNVLLILSDLVISFVFMILTSGYCPWLYLEKKTVLSNRKRMQRKERMIQNQERNIQNERGT